MVKLSKSTDKMKKFNKKTSKAKIPAGNPSKRIKKTKTKTIGKKLEQIDPELFNYLQQNDKKLLDCEETDLEEFSDSDDEKPLNEKENDISSDENENDADSNDEDANENGNEENSEVEEESDSESESEEKEEVDKPSDSLEVGSDESDFEDDSGLTGKITISMVNQWEKDLQTNKRSIKPVATVVKAFHACLVRVTGETDAKVEKGFKVDGSAVFNAVVRLCVTSLYPYLQKIMNLPASSISKKSIQNSKKWSYAKNTVRIYIADLIKLIKNVSSEDILRVLLKHFHQMTPFATCLPTISKPILKQLISLWCTSTDDTVRVISFLCILRFAVSDPTAYLHTILKKMYVSYISNCKFISHNAVATVNFMRKSLTEMFSLNETVSYNHAFLYIRQLAIHLRSAVITKKKDSVQAVYNWQFISSLRVWVDVLCSMREKQSLNSLIYPLTQIIIGCIKLIPTAQYFPLRFHCIQMLIKLSKETETFIPVLPFIVEVFSILNVNNQHKKLSMKPIDFTYILRLSKAQMQEIAFKDAVMEGIYESILEYSAAESHRISFPDTVLFLQIQTKQFIKECKNTNYTRKLKPLLEKIEEVSKIIDTERSKCGISLSDEKSVRAWESNMKLKTNPLTEFYKTWAKMNEQSIIRRHTDNIQLTECELPVSKKLPNKKNNKPAKENDESDDDDNNDTFSKERKENTSKNTRKNKDKKKNNAKKRKLETEARESNKKKPKKNRTNDVDDTEDIVEDFNMSEFLSE